MPRETGRAARRCSSANRLSLVPLPWFFFSFFFLFRLNKFDEYNVSSQATAWVKK